MEKRIPKVRVGNVWVPAHKIWNVVESITTATDLVEKFNEEREHLATPVTQEVVGTVRTRIRDMDLAMGGPGALEKAAREGAAILAGEDPAADNDHGSNEMVADDAPTQQGSNEVEGGNGALSDEEFAQVATQLLEAMPVEDVLQMLEQDYGRPYAARDLVGIVGPEAYGNALRREADEFAMNMISPDQVAVLWNESGYPRPDGGLWTEADVHKLNGQP